jgi:hypothetical protein
LQADASVFVLNFPKYCGDTGKKVMRISPESLRGYLLEEVLAYLIRNSGYKLLVDPSQDTWELGRRGNGLVVKGRGGVHQVDVLGELKWIPAFSFPLRLFVEAKFRDGRTGIDAVRNAIGVLLDVNEKYSGENVPADLRKYYRYIYALFSVSGFSDNAIRMALAHQISLIDLGGDEFNNLKNEIIRTADNISANIQEFDGENMQDSSRGKIVSAVRETMRRRLNTWPSDVEPPYTQQNDEISRALTGVIEQSHEYGELFVGMADGPFMLLLKASNPTNFLEYAKRSPTHNVVIHWNPNIDQGRTWTINPANEHLTYTLTFRLPDILDQWIFSKESLSRGRALQAKQAYFSDITIYYSS